MESYVEPEGGENDIVGVSPPDDTIGDVPETEVKNLPFDHAFDATVEVSDHFSHAEAGRLPRESALPTEPMPILANRDTGIFIVWIPAAVEIDHVVFDEDVSIEILCVVSVEPLIERTA